MKSKVITLSAITMVGLLLVFAMLDIGTSTKISGILSQGIYKILNRLGDSGYTISDISFIVRKIGHFGFYALLSPMIALVIIKKSNRLSLSVVLSGALTLTLALLDELIQKYALGRNSSYLDIMIDGAGAFIGLLIFAVTVWAMTNKDEHGVRR